MALTEKQKRIHLANMRKQGDAYDAKQKATFTMAEVRHDNMPGALPVEDTYDPNKQIHLSTEEMERNMDVGEGQTILKGNNISSSKRKAIENHIK